jgi:hypothetical protein
MWAALLRALLRHVLARLLDEPTCLVAARVCRSWHVGLGLRLAPTNLTWWPAPPSMPPDKDATDSSPSLVLVWAPHASTLRALRLAQHAIHQSGRYEPDIVNLTSTSRCEIRGELWRLEERAGAIKVRHIAIVRASDVFTREDALLRFQDSGYLTLYLLVDITTRSLPIMLQWATDTLQEEAAWAVVVPPCLTKPELTCLYDCLSPVRGCPAIVSPAHGCDAWRLCYYDLMSDGATTWLCAQASRIALAPTNRVYSCE